MDQEDDSLNQRAAVCGVEVRPDTIAVIADIGRRMGDEYERIT